MVQEQNSGNSATAPSAAASASTTKKDNRSENTIDSNQKNLIRIQKISNRGTKNRRKSNWENQWENWADKEDHWWWTCKVGSRTAKT